MKKQIKKLLCSSFIAFMSIGINFNAEARVTREVAEAVLPYLMEAAGIPSDPLQEESSSSPSMTTSSSSSSSSSSASSSSSSASSSSVHHVPNYDSKKINAIIDMIYTDEGQQQMVDWAVNDQKPSILAGDNGPFREEWPETSNNRQRW